MSIGDDYIKNIKNARSPLMAALYIRALATHQADKLTCYSADQRLSIITEAEQHAETLERDFDGEKPWRQWLKEWGYC